MTESRRASRAWQAALTVRDTSLDLPDDFYQQELEACGAGARHNHAGRIPNCTPHWPRVILSRAKRDAVWPVFEEYRGQLSSRKLKEVDDAYREVASMLLSGWRCTSVQRHRHRRDARFWSPGTSVAQSHDSSWNQ